MEPLRYITPNRATTQVVPLTPAVQTGKLLFVSGIPGYDANRVLAKGDFPAQFKQVMENIRAILAEAGTDFSQVVKMNVLLTRREDIATMNSLYGAYFEPGKYPARTTSVVVALPDPDFLLEIECVAQMA